MNDFRHLLASLSEFEQQVGQNPLTLGDALNRLHGAAYPLISLLLVIPLFQPFPLGPMTVVVGLTFTYLGWQLWQGRTSPVLPRTVLDISFSRSSWKKISRGCWKVADFCHTFTKPRLHGLVKSRQGQRIGGMILMVAGMLMAIPFGILPFNNVLPGLAILFYCLADIEGDGLMTLIAFGWILVTALYFVAFFIALYFLGTEVLEHLKI
jgi:hypothetical protein